MSGHEDRAVSITTAWPPALQFSNCWLHLKYISKYKILVLKGCIIPKLKYTRPFLCLLLRVGVEYGLSLYGKNTDRRCWRKWRGRKYLDIKGRRSKEARENCIMTIFTAFTPRDIPLERQNK
jgi:hypothetical protein